MSRASNIAYARIRAMIVSGELEAGRQLREEELAELCGVSRTPVREAIGRLVVEMLVRRNDTHRIFVADWSDSDVDDLFALRSLFEGYAASAAARHIDERQLAALHRVNAEIEAAITLATPDVGAFVEGNRLFHSIVVEAARSSRLKVLRATIVQQVVIHRTALRYSREDLFQSHNDHLDLVSAFTGRDAEWANAVMVSHIRRAANRYKAEQAALLALPDEAATRVAIPPGEL